MQIQELSNAQRKQFINVQQVFEAYENELRRGAHRFDGSMGWSKRGDKEYLIRKRQGGRVTKSLGPRSPGTEMILQDFNEGRRDFRQSVRVLEARLEAMAATNVEMGLGRVPAVTARICRHLSAAGILGNGVRVIGTTALFAYEAAAGVQFHSSLTATTDADLLVDVRRRMKILANGGADDPRSLGTMVQLLQAADPTFRVNGHKDTAYRLVNDDGFWVDFVRTQAKDEMMLRDRTTATDHPGDLHPAPVAGLNWLRDAPAFSAIAIDESGIPVRLEVPDPRSFALLKEWVSQQPERDPLKKPRDRDQSEAVVSLLATKLVHLPEDGLTHVPAHWRERFASRVAEARADSGESDEGDEFRPRFR